MTIRTLLHHCEGKCTEINSIVFFNRNSPFQAGTAWLAKQQGYISYSLAKIEEIIATIISVGDCLITKANNG